MLEISSFTKVNKYYTEHIKPSGIVVNACGHHATGSEFCFKLGKVKAARTNLFCQPSTKFYETFYIGP